MPTLSFSALQSSVLPALRARSSRGSSLPVRVLVAPAQKGSSPRLAPSNSGPQCNLVGCIPYTTARVANSTVNGTPATAVQPVGGMPYVATGRLWMATTTAGQFNSVCTASLIGKGLVVTAAHCIQRYGLGDAGTVKSVRFIPANNGNTLSSGPYGGWDVAHIIQPAVYKAGTDTCSTAGIVCSNDVAVLVLAKNPAGQFPFSVPQIYYYNYGINGYGFVSPSGGSGGNGQITQLGYPCGLDNCQLMQRNDSIGAITGTGIGSSPKQITIGSQMTGGSSGGPWLVNFGTQSALTGAGAGRAPVNNVVQATTSWGYVNNQIQIQGASLFATNPQFPIAQFTTDGRTFPGGNIGTLVNEACRSTGTAKGFTTGACW